MRYKPKNTIFVNMFIMAFAILFGIGCGQGTNVDTTVLLEDILTLELSFGDEDSALPSEFLLASPNDMDVSKTGEIFVVDENMIKIYDADGLPLRTVGKQGLGPGELEYARAVDIGPTGYISILDRFGVSLFHEGDRSPGTPDYGFVEKINFRNSKLHSAIVHDNGWDTANLASMIYLTEKKQIIHVSGRIQPDNGQPEQFNGLIINNDGAINTRIAIREDHIYRFTSENGGASISFKLGFLSKFSWAIASDNRIVYYDSSEESINGDGTPVYVLSVMSEETEIVTQIIRTYERMEISTNQMNRYDGTVKANSQYFPDLKDSMNGVKNIMRDEKYTVALQEILVDREYVFAYTYKQNENEELFADIFNLDTGDYVSSAYFPGVPKKIKNGYAYYLIRGSEKEFPRIEKYKIDPGVYRKR